MGKYSVVCYSTAKTMNFLPPPPPEKYPLYGIEIDICLEKIRGPGATYEGVTRGPGFGAEMSIC